jgi:hypothetical protein
MTNKIPEWFMADRLTPVGFYGYTSSVSDEGKIFEIPDVHTSTDTEAIGRFHDLKRKCLAMCIDMAREADSEPVWTKDIWDAKIVIECLTEDGRTIYVGYWDFKYSIGIKVDTRIIRRRPYRAVENPVKEL